MRTTVEIPDAFRARLLEIAARRGEKGFSHLITEALESFLNAEDARARRIQAALDTIGSLSDREIESLETARDELRATWR